MVVSNRDRIGKMLEALQEPFCIANQHLYVTASVGISVYPDDGKEAGILQQNADIAMYRAKNSAKNGFQFYAAGMIEPMRERLELENGLRGAIQRAELFIHYQPLYGIGKVEGADDPVGTLGHPELDDLRSSRLMDQHCLGFAQPG